MTISKRFRLCFSSRVQADLHRLGFLSGDQARLSRAAFGGGHAAPEATLIAAWRAGPNIS